MTDFALSLAPMAHEMLSGERLVGTALGHGYIAFGRRVLALTPPGAPRMPNGIETTASVTAGDLVRIGGGRLTLPDAEIWSGPAWNPRPELRRKIRVEPRWMPSLAELVGRGEGLTPLGDDITIGYLAGLALSGRSARARARRLARHTTALAGTLIVLAAEGQLPEPAHALLEDGDIGPLLAFGATSGAGIALGLALALAPAAGPAVEEESFTLRVPFGARSYAIAASH